MHMLTFKLASDPCKINNAVFKYVLRGSAELRLKCSEPTKLNSWWISATIFRFVMVLIYQPRLSHLLGSCCPLSIFAMTFFLVIVSTSPQTSPVVSSEVVHSLNFTGSREDISRINYVVAILLISLMRCFSSVRQMLPVHTGTERNLELWKYNYCLREMFCSTYLQMLVGSHPVLPS